MIREVPPVVQKPATLRPKIDQGIERHLSNRGEGGRHDSPGGNRSADFWPHCPEVILFEGSVKFLEDGKLDEVELVVGRSRLLAQPPALGPVRPGGSGDISDLADQAGSGYRGAPSDRLGIVGQE